MNTTSITPGALAAAWLLLCWLAAVGLARAADPGARQRPQLPDGCLGPPAAPTPAPHQRRERALPDAPPTTWPARDGLLTRTSGAIYRALSDLFVRDQAELDEPEPVSEPPAAGQRFGRRHGPALSTTGHPHVELDSYQDEPFGEPVATTTGAPIRTSTKKKPAAPRLSQPTPTPSSAARLTSSTTVPPKPPTTTVAPHKRTTTVAPKPPTTTRPPKPPTTTVAPKPAPTTTVAPKSTTTTAAPRPTTTRAPKSATTEPPTRDQGAAPNGDQTGELYGLIGTALRSIHSLSEQFAYLNRTTRLVHGHELADTELEAPGQPSDKLVAIDDDRTGANRSGKTFATQEDIHLLCKLLHKHLQTNNGSASLVPTLASPDQATGGTGSAAASPAGVSTTTARPAATGNVTIEDRQQEPGRSLFIAHLNDLNDAHESRLLESTFAIERQNGSALALGDAYEQTGQKALVGLFNLARRATYSEYESDEPRADSYAAGQANASATEPSVALKLWSKSLSGGRRGRLKLVYWLVEPLVGAPPGRPANAKLRVLEAREALHLVDRLDHATIRRQIEPTHLRPVVLVAPYRPTLAGAGDEPPATTANDDDAPNVIDDTLITVVPKPRHQTDNNKANHQAPATSGLGSFVDKLTNGSLSDNLYLYIILLSIAIFIMVLCFALPAICCCKQASARNKSPLFNGSHDHMIQPSSTISGALSKSGYNLNNRSATKRNNNQQHLQQANDAIWRKLSNSTTTLVKDRAHVLRNDGTIDVPVLREQPAGAKQTPTHQERADRAHQFEWYSFEDRLEQEELSRRDTSDKQAQTLIVSDRRQLTKSVQTFDPPLAYQDAHQTLLMSCRDRHEARSSDTLTKSELVMLKEKLVPIGAGSRSAAHHQQVATQTSDPEAPSDNGQQPDYVNTMLSTETRRTGVEQIPTRFIDSSNSSSSDKPSAALVESMEPFATSVGGARLCSSPIPSSSWHQDSVQPDVERRPKMRHLELPPKYGTKVDAIKSELGRLEQRDASTAANQGTYKRFDHVT